MRACFRRLLGWQLSPGHQHAQPRRWCCSHFEQAVRDKAKCDDVVQEAERRRLPGLAQLYGKEHTGAACDLLAHRTLRARYVRQTKGGKLITEN